MRYTVEMTSDGRIYLPKILFEHADNIKDITSTI
jgi:hypothetical protein